MTRECLLEARDSPCPVLSCPVRLRTLCLCLCLTPAGREQGGRGRAQRPAVGLHRAAQARLPLHPPPSSRVFPASKALAGACAPRSAQRNVRSAQTWVFTSPCGKSARGARNLLLEEEEACTRARIHRERVRFQPHRKMYGSDSHQYEYPRLAYGCWHESDPYIIFSLWAEVHSTPRLLLLFALCV